MRNIRRSVVLVSCCMSVIAGCGKDSAGDDESVDALLFSTRNLNREFEPHQSPAELTGAAQFVFTGRVIEVSQGRAFYGEPDQPPAMVTVQLQVDIEEVIKGSPDILGDSVVVEITIGSEDELGRAVDGGVAAKESQVLFFADDFTKPAWKVITELGPTDDLILAPWTDGAWLLDEAGRDAALGIYVDRAELGGDWTKVSSGAELVDAAKIGS